MLNGRLDPQGSSPPKSGLVLLQGLILALFCVFMLRLWYLQIYKGDFFSAKAQENRMRQLKIYAPRGMMRDRYGVLLAVNEPAYALGLVREDCADIKATLNQVAAWAGMEPREMQKLYERGRSRTKAFEPQILISDLGFELMSRIESESLFWPGLKIVVRTRRYYPQGPVLAHVLGYVAEANEEELNHDSGLDLGDGVGKQGLEYVLEKSLRGTKGVKEVEVDASGRYLKDLTVTQPSAGVDVTLSLDFSTQKLIVDQLGDHAGAVVVLEPDTGKVIALVSQPSFDNNIFVGGLTSAVWKELRDDPRHPLLNRPVQSTYPPGSVFKLAMAGAVLEELKANPAERISCGGAFSLGSHVFQCWKKTGHGPVDLYEALTHSCDVYFYTMGDRLGVDRIWKYTRACGLGEKTGIDLPHEKSGLIPSREWKKRNPRDPAWHRGETINMSIGQGYTNITPLQVARFVGALVNGGRLLKPNLLENAPVTEQGLLPMTMETRKRINDAMINTVKAGTAKSLDKPGCVIGGKTGTAQVVSLPADKERKRAEASAYQTRDHAWMASFGEKGDKRYVVVAMVEHGGHGGEVAGPVVRAVYDHLFSNKTLAERRADDEAAMGHNATGNATAETP